MDYQMCFWGKFWQRFVNKWDEGFLLHTLLNFKYFCNTDLYLWAQYFEILGESPQGSFLLHNFNGGGELLLITFFPTISRSASVLSTLINICKNVHSIGDNTPIETCAKLVSKWKVVNIQVRAWIQNEFLTHNCIQQTQLTNAWEVI